MKATKLVIGASLLIALAAMPTVSAEPTYQSHFDDDCGGTEELTNTGGSPGSAQIGVLSCVAAGPEECSVVSSVEGIEGAKRDPAQCVLGN